MIEDKVSAQVIEVENSLHQAISKALLELKSQVKSTDDSNKVISDSIKILEAHEITTRKKRPNEITYEMKLKILEDIFMDEKISRLGRKSEKTIHGFDRIFSTQHGTYRVIDRDPNVKHYVVENCDKLLFPLLAFFSPSGLKNILFLNNLERAQTVLHNLNHIIAKNPRFAELKNLFPSNIGSFVIRVANQNTNPHIVLKEILDNIEKLKIIGSTFGFDSDRISSIFSSSRTYFSKKVDDIITHKDIIIKWIKESDLDDIVTLLSNKNNLNDAIPIFDKLNIHLMIKNDLINNRDLQSYNSINKRITFLKSKYYIDDENLAKLSTFCRSDSKKIDSQEPHPDSLIRERRNKKRKATVLLESDNGVHIDSSTDLRIGSSDGISSTFEEISGQMANSSQRVTNEEDSDSISENDDDFRNHVREAEQPKSSSPAIEIIRPTALPSFALDPNSSPATSGNLSISVSNGSSALAGVSAFNSSAGSAFNRRA